MRPSLGDEGREEIEKGMLPAHKRPRTFEEETANGVSHGIAPVACLSATPFLLSSASRLGGTWSADAAGIFAGATPVM
jgi:predicted membrane channel-forming protein YqfA (hemolysin III family)